MVQSLFRVSTGFDPYVNLAEEQLLMESLKPHEQILFLWQNSDTIVLGRNQDAFRECKVDEFQQDGGRIARRLSGGGAVYHDLGNLNFSFISPASAYDVAQNLSIICKTVQSFGLDAKPSGRNDIEIDGTKFSGNAFYRTKNACCHHGTLMVSVDTRRLARYLHPDSRKLKTRSVASVASRVANLNDLEQNISIDTLSNSLLECFFEHYGTAALEVSSKRMDSISLMDKTGFFASEEWCLDTRSGIRSSSCRRLSYRFDWGGFDLQFNEMGGRVNDLKVYSDALDVEFILAVSTALEGISCEPTAFEELFRVLALARPEYREMLEDCLMAITEDLRRTT